MQRRLLLLLRSRWALRLWIVVIVFSQTGLAGALADALVLWLFGGRPEGGEEWLRLLMQKGYHVGLFGVAGLLIGLGEPARRGPAWHGLLWCVGLSVFGETLQLLAPARSPQFSDAALNVISALVGRQAAISGTKKLHR